MILRIGFLASRIPWLVLPTPNVLEAGKPFRLVLFVVHPLSLTTSTLHDMYSIWYE